MKKKIISTLVAGSMLLSFVACNQQTSNNSHSENEEETTTAIEETTGETTGETSGVSVVPVSASELTSEAEWFEPLSEASRLFPIYLSVDRQELNAYIYTFNPDYFDNVKYKMGFADISGNFIYGDFSFVRYFEENDCYIAVKKGEFGIEQCGLIKADGTKCTGYDFNGYYIDYDGKTYLSKYENGTMVISCYDTDLNPIFEGKEIKVDPSISSALHSGIGICVREVYDNTTVVGSMETYHDLKNYLVDNETGDVLNPVSRICGNVLVADNSVGINVYDKDGNEILEGYKRYIYFEKESMILFNDTEVVAVDHDGNTYNKIDLKEGYYVDNTDNFVVINNNYETNVYDKYLNHITKTEETITLSAGIVMELIEGDYTSIIHANFEGGFFENIISGNYINADLYNSIYYFERDLGMLYIDSSVNASDDMEYVKGYFDKDLNFVTDEYPCGYISKDLVTGDVYLSVYDSDEDMTTVYKALTDEVVFEASGKLNNYYQVYDGVICGILGNEDLKGNTTVVYNSVVAGTDGSVIFSCEVENMYQGVFIEN